jgi:hypothetical protein
MHRTGRKQEEGRAENGLFISYRKAIDAKGVFLDCGLSAVCAASRVELHTTEGTPVEAHCPPGDDSNAGNRNWMPCIAGNRPACGRR